jgi:hypothetical protein
MIDTSLLQSIILFRSLSIIPFHLSRLLQTLNIKQQNPNNVAKENINTFFILQLSPVKVFSFLKKIYTNKLAIEI